MMKIITHHYAVLDNKAVLEPWVLPAFAITYFCNHCNIIFDQPVKVICENLPKDHYVQVQWKYITDHFSQTLAKRSMTLRWHLTPHMLISDVRLYPRISVSNSHGNTSKYIDAVTMYQKLTQKVNDPKMTFDPTSVEVIMCDSTQGSLYPSPMKICQNMWIQLPLFLKKKIEPNVIYP